MELKINRRKLPVKYALEIYQDLKGYPSHQDLEYILVSALIDQNTQEFTPESIWKRMKVALGTINDLRGFLEYLAQPDDLTDKQIFNVEIERGLNSYSYKLISHKWQ